MVDRGTRYYQTVNVGLEPHDLRRGPITLDRGAHEYTGSSGYSQEQGHRDWLLIKGNRKRKALSVGEWVLVKEDSRGW